MYVLWLHLIFITIIPFGTLLALNIVIYRKLTEVSTLIKKKTRFSSYIRSCKVIYEEGLPNRRGNAQIFNNISGGL